MTLLSSFNTLVSTGRLLRLLALLLCLLSGRLLGLLLLGFESLLATKLLAPLLLLLWFDLGEEIAGRADLVADGDRLCLPLVGDDEELGIQLGEDGGGSIGPVS